MDLALLNPAGEPSLRLLTVNAGSSSLKLRLLEAGGSVVTSADLDGTDEVAARRAVAGMGRIDAVVHRFVHGGDRLTTATRLDAEVEAYLESLTELAPLHQPRALAGVRFLRSLAPGLPEFACFDTGFHSTLPAAASTYALPEGWRRRYGIRRFGFHGLSHAHVAARAAELTGRGDLRLVSCHLGAGASLAAISAGVSRDTTMGFTPLEGLVMATRAGSVDPGLLLWLETAHGLSAAELGDALEHRSGLLALAGTADMREVVAGAESGLAPARLALDVYLHRLRAQIAAMAAALGGIDALVFTGGVGENGAVVRAEAVAGLGFLGLALDAERNRSATPDSDLSAAGAKALTLVVAAREDLQMLREVRGLLP